MSDENNNNNNELSQSKTNISPNEQDNINTNSNNEKNLNSLDNNEKKELVSSIITLENMPSSKTLIDDMKTTTNALDNETINTETTNKDSILKRGAKLKKSIRKKRKKGKKGKKVEPEPEPEPGPEIENVLLTEVKPIPKKLEESLSHKYLRKKLENLNFDKNLQSGIKSGIEKVKDEIKDDLEENLNIIKNKKLNIEEIISKSKKNINLNLTDKAVNFKVDKESIIRLKNLKRNEKFIKSELNKIEENKKLLESELPLKNDIILLNTRKYNLKRMNSTKNDLLKKLKYNSVRISELLDNNKEINKNLLIKNYLSQNTSINSKDNDINHGNYKKKIHSCLSEDQERFNKHLLKIQNEEKIQKEKFEKDLKITKDKKIKEIELKESKKLQRQKNYLEELKNKEKEFFNKIKEKNNLILEKSSKHIGDKNHKNIKEYLFYQYKENFENNEKKLIDKVNMIKKDSLVTKKELKELANKRKEQKKILEEGLNERKIKLIKMWRQRSQNLPVYKHPVVDMMEDEEYDLLEDEEDKKEQKEKNEKEKKNYQPPEVKIDFRLKEIREKRNLKTNKDSVIKTENNNKKRFLKNLNFIANIIEAAKEENLEKNKYKIKMNNKNLKTENIVNRKKRNKVAKSFEKHNYKLHPKPEKPIDYLKDIIKNTDNKKNKKKVDVGVGDLEAELKDGGKKGVNHIIETFDMVKSKTNAIDKKVIEKKEYLKAKGGYMNNTKLGDEVGNLIIESIQAKLSLLNKINGP